ncbi:MAG: amidohydrolase family protein, partial [Eubacteriales bacterium]
TLKQKLGGTDFTKCPNGLPGVEMRMPLLFSEGVLKKRISPEHFAKLTATNPAKLFGLYPQKGSIRMGSDADIVILDLNKKQTITHANLHENVDYTPYEGMEILCAVDMVLSRGEVVVQNNQYTGTSARGQFIRRNKPILDL